MKVHHLNCGTDCPLGGRPFDGVSRSAFGSVVWSYAGNWVTG